MVHTCVGAQHVTPLAPNEQHVSPMSQSKPDELNLRHKRQAAAQSPGGKAYRGGDRRFESRRPYEQHCAPPPGKKQLPAISSPQHS